MIYYAFCWMNRGKGLLQLIFIAFRAAICCRRCRPVDCNDDHVATWLVRRLCDQVRVFWLVVRLFDFIGMSARRSPTWFQRNELFPLHSAILIFFFCCFGLSISESNSSVEVHFQFQLPALVNHVAFHEVAAAIVASVRGSSPPKKSFVNEIELERAAGRRRGGDVKMCEI